MKKVALVTGGTSGIGRAIAMGFARAGGAVVIAARGAERGERVAEEIRAAGGDALFVAADVSRRADVAALIEKTVAAYGRLDCAFNNAAIVGEFRLLAEYGEEEFDALVANDLKSVWMCMKHELEVMTKQGGGAIVNTSSVNGLGGVPRSALYAMSKAGVIALTKSAALEYASQGIRVNALVAGAFRTPMLEGVFDTFSGGDAKAREQLENSYHSMIPLARLGTPDEAAAAALWLASDEASYVTGHSMIVDGGATAPFR